MSLKEKLGRGDFVITLEISPPGDSAMDEFIQTARENEVDAINVPDNQRGIPRLSSLVASKILLDNKIEPIMHLSCANRNRIEMESLILGAEALKIPNLLIITGDHPLVAENRQAKSVFDIDSVDALRLAKEKSGLYLGAVANQLANIELQAELVGRKVDAGAEFIQTQPVFEIERLEKLIDAAAVKTRWIAGVMPVRSVEGAEFISKRIPGIQIPKEIIQKLKGSKNPDKEGIQIMRNILDELKGVGKISGVSLMCESRRDSHKLRIFDSQFEPFRDRHQRV